MYLRLGSIPQGLAGQGICLPGDPSKCKHKGWFKGYSLFPLAPGGDGQSDLRGFLGQGFINAWLIAQLDFGQGSFNLVQVEKSRPEGRKTGILQELFDVGCSFCGNPVQRE